MVKKKGKSKRISLKDKYKIQRRVVETHRKRKKEAKRDVANGTAKKLKKKKDPGIPNSWPFKQDLLKDIKRAKERQIEQQAKLKQKRSDDLKLLREHQEKGGTARTVEELMAKAHNDNALYEAKNVAGGGNETEAGGTATSRSDGSKAPGQSSRRAYLRELKKVVDTSDVILQVLDARDPVNSRIRESIESAILSKADKRMVLVLNKIDLVPRQVVGAWLTTLRRSHPAIAIRASGLDRSSGGGGGGGGGDDNASTVTGTASTNAPVGMDGLLQLLKNYARTGGTGGKKSKTTIVVGVIGYPNVGKSSIINALKRCRAVGVSPRPGFTTSMQEVVLDRNVRLLDSPGVVFDDDSAMLGNCVDPDSVEDPIPAVEALLARCNHESLIMNYNIPSFPPRDVYIFLAMVAKSHGRVLKGGVPDKVAAARTVLRDWNQGKIPYFTAPPAPEENSNAPHVSNDAVIVSKFSNAFDLSKFDDAVLASLKDSDEMDFVQLVDDSHENKGAAVAAADKAAINFLTGQGGGSDDDDDDESMEEEEEEEEGCGGTPESSKRRAMLADAEDYDFEMMS